MQEERYWLIAYDIRNPRRLARVAKCISSYAWRLQKSIFEAHITADTMAQLEKRLNAIIRDDDTILILPICACDRGKRKICGLAGSTDPMQDSCMML